MTSEPETGLPAWTYTDPDFLTLERAQIFKRAWQIVCHESDVRDAGQYATLQFLGDLILVVRGDDGVLRAFRNVCRHRAARLMDNSFGKCGRRIVCPYHAWTYDLAGRLIGVPDRDQYEPFDLEDYSLMRLDMEIAGGFIFVRPAPDGQAFDDFIAPMQKDFDLYKMSEMKALGRITIRERAVNWKIATENYVDAMHLPIAHNGLNSLAGATYTLAIDGDAYRIDSEISAAGSQSPSVRAYLKYLPAVDYLPATHRTKWSYVKLWPNLAFDIYPDQIDFMQFIPASPGVTILREISYALPDDRREMRAARYLNWRINRVVNLEDKDLIERVQAGFGIDVYTPGPIAKSEICLRDFASRMRREIPVASAPNRPHNDVMTAALDQARGRN